MAATTGLAALKPMTTGSLGQGPMIGTAAIKPTATSAMGAAIAPPLGSLAPKIGDAVRPPTSVADMGTAGGGLGTPVAPPSVAGHQTTLALPPSQAITPTGPPPAAIQPPAPQAMPTTPTSGYGPGNDLRATQINPVADPRLAQTQGLVNQAAQAIGHGPDRFQLAQDQWNQFVNQTDPQYQAAIRAATQNAAAHGRMQSGMLTTDYGNLANQRALALDTQRNQFLDSALSGTIQDRLNNASALSGLEGQQYGQGYNSRQELRGERGYQTDMQNQATDRAIQQKMLEDQLLNSSFNRQMQVAGLGSQVGFGNNPANTYLLGANQSYNQAGQSGAGLADLLGQYAYGQQTRGPLPTGTPYAQPPVQNTGPNGWGGSAQ